MHASDIGLAGLGYVGVNAPDIEAWRAFATGVCGLAPSAIVPGPRPAGIAVPAREARGVAPDGTLYLKMDQRQWRLAVHPAADAGLAYLGFELPGVDALSSAVDAVAKRGASVREATREEREARGVAGLAVLDDPAGHRIELFVAPIADDPFHSPLGVEFLTGSLGMGHAVLYVPDLDAALAFYREVLGFQRTDYMTFGPEGKGIHFLRCTRRHHSLALLHVGPLSGLQHLMLETTTLDAVGQALDRAQSADVTISSSLGRHRNDRTVSFYMHGPSGFDVEIGWDGLLVDDDWVEHEFAGSGDLWGHQGLSAESLEKRD